MGEKGLCCLNITMCQVYSKTTERQPLHLCWYVTKTLLAVQHVLGCAYGAEFCQVVVAETKHLFALSAVSFMIFK